MALFTKKTWKNRLSEYPTRRKLTKENGTTELVTVARSEGTVSQEGDAFSAANMNNLEDRISKAIGTGDIPEDLGTDIISAINALNTGLDLEFIEDTSSTILSLVLKKRKVGRITGFRTKHAAADAPSKENWNYTYIIIHIATNIYMVQAFRAYSPQGIYQRICADDVWSGNWFAFDGHSL